MRIYWGSLVLILLGGALQAAAQSAPASLRRAPERLMVVGHAGSGFFRPLNTFNPLPPSSLRSELEALENGADGLEIDIQLSQDSVPMLYHNVDLPSMTKTGKGCVSDHPAAALTQLRYRGGWPYDWFQHEKIVTLDTLLAQLAHRPTFPYLHFDLHEDLPCLTPPQRAKHSAALARQLVRLLQQYRVPAERVLFVTDQVGTVRRLQRLWPSAAIGFEITEDFAANLRTAQAEKAQAVVLSESLTMPANVAAAHAAGLAVVAFGGRSTQRITQLVAAHPDGYEVDNVPKLLRILGRAPAPNAR